MNAGPGPFRQGSEDLGRVNSRASPAAAAFALHALRGAPVGSCSGFRCGSACDGRHGVRRKSPRRQRRRARAAATAAAMSSATCMLEAGGGAAAAQRARTCVCVSSTARLRSTWQAQKSTTKATGEGSGRRFNERLLTRLPPRVAAYWRALRLLRLSLTCACGSRTPSSRSR